MEAQPPPTPQDFSWRRAPDLLADRLGVSPGAVLVGLGVVAAAALGAWWALRPPPPEPTELGLPRVEAVVIESATTTLPAPSPVIVHVAGAVVAPGVHEVQPGARVIDAIEAAGGLTSDADRNRLNLALVVVDQERIWVPRLGEEEPPVVVPTGASGSSAATSDAGPVVNINQADAARLEALPGIGPSLAAAIVEHRDRQGPFGAVDDLLAVSGIGPAKLAQLRDRATV